MTSVRTESVAMKLAKALGLPGLAWSLRRLHCPVAEDALVLDVGSGGNPYPRANVLLDAYEDSPERFHDTLVKDRPMVFGIVERLPFRDKAFDFVIASHVLEHTASPEAFLGELMRVGKAGYIETPDGFFERVNPFRFHRLEVSIAGSVLEIKKKASWRHGGDVVDMYERRFKKGVCLPWLAKRPDLFHTRFFWSGAIAYRVENTEVACDWPLPEGDYGGGEGAGRVGRQLRKQVVRAVRWLFSQNRRNRFLNLGAVLACPSCRSGKVQETVDGVRCLGCDTTYEKRDGVPVMYPVAASEAGIGAVWRGDV